MFQIVFRNHRFFVVANCIVLIVSPTFYNYFNIDFDLHTAWL